MEEILCGGKTVKRKESAVLQCVAAVFAVLIGAINVLFGGGGGMLAVPTLRYCFGLDEKKAHASAVAVMFPLSCFSAIALTSRGVSDATLALTVGCGAVLGGAVGGILLNKVPRRIISLLFYVVMIYAGIRFLI